jgi:hypothetical protein
MCYSKRGPARRWSSEEVARRWSSEAVAVKWEVDTEIVDEFVAGSDGEGKKEVLFDYAHKLKVHKRR